MRIAWRRPGVPSDGIIRVFRSPSLMRVVAVALGGGLVCGGFSMVMTVREQTLGVAIRSCQQPGHNAARRSDAETDVNLWLP